MAVSSRLFVTPTISAHDKRANRVYSAAQWMPPRSPPGASRSTCWSPASTRASRSTTRWRATRASPTLDPRDRAFVRLLLATTLRRLGEIDEVLAGMIERPLEGANAAGRQVLRLGAAQLLFLGTPAHAAVDTSVGLVVEAGLPHLKGLANAVLRRIAREGVTLLGDRDPARLNTPKWLWQSWTEAYGEEATRAIAAAHLIEAPLDLTPRSDAEFWAGRMEGELLATGTIRRAAGGAITDLPGFAEGAWWVQDAAATLPVRLLGDVAGKRVADLCAAPGGKTLQLCAAGAQVTAVDISARRMARVSENLVRAGFAAQLVTADASKWTPAEKFDAILIDAPCSGTGTLRRHPDIAWLKDKEDVDGSASPRIACWCTPSSC